MINDKTAWFNTTDLPNEMVRGALGLNGWPRLENTDHFGVLNEMIRYCDVNNFADVGCGAGELGRVYTNHNYTGFDLPHIIEKVAKIVNPTLEYHHFNADDSDYSIFENYDLLICNGFISELTNPIEVLSKLLKHTKKNLLIHRQYFSESNELKGYKTYANLNTVRCSININDFNKLLKEYKVVKRRSTEYGDTLLIAKIEGANGNY
jgi:trans-aconitate methyltransferase